MQNTFTDKLWAFNVVQLMHANIHERFPSLIYELKQLLVCVVKSFGFLYSLLSLLLT